MLVVCPLTDLCGENGFQCPDGTCLSAEDRCDGEVHCSDGSDEPITCGKFKIDSINDKLYLVFACGICG